MKIISILLGVALLMITGILVFLLKSGGALKPAGVIKPAEIGSDIGLVGRSIALRLFPEFQEAKNVIWFLETQDEALAKIPEVTHLNYQNPQKPALHDLRQGLLNTCTEHCWYIQQAGIALPETLLQKMKTESSLEIYIQYFDRNEQVPETCEKEKVLEPKCIKPISVREVRRKLKTEAPYFFMQRYLSSQFYLFIEKTK